MVRRGVAVVLVFAALGLMPPSAAAAGDGLSETILLVPGGDGTSIQGRVQGAAAHSFRLPATAGQRLIVSFAASNPKACLDLVAPDGTTILFEGEQGASHIDMVLPVSGEFLLRVELSESAAARGERADYRLIVRIPGAG
jgi:hypothetical protein